MIMILTSKEIKVAETNSNLSEYITDHVTHISS